MHHLIQSSPTARFMRSMRIVMQPAEERDCYRRAERAARNLWPSSPLLPSQPAFRLRSSSLMRTHRGASPRIGLPCSYPLLASLVFSAPARPPSESGLSGLPPTRVTPLRARVGGYFGTTHPSGFALRDLPDLPVPK
jgi:hypothetical protein